MFAALGIDGVVRSTVVNSAVSADVFEAFRQTALVPRLRPATSWS
jgi:hypothetical protein